MEEISKVALAAVAATGKRSKKGELVEEAVGKEEEAEGGHREERAAEGAARKGGAGKAKATGVGDSEAEETGIMTEGEEQAEAEAAEVAWEEVE